MQYEGSKERRKDEENKAEPILEAKYACDCANEAVGDKLDAVYGVVIEQDMRGKEPLLLIVQRHSCEGGREQVIITVMFAFTRSQSYTPRNVHSPGG